MHDITGLNLSKRDRHFSLSIHHTGSKYSDSIIVTGKELIDFLDGVVVRDIGYLWLLESRPKQDEEGLVHGIRVLSINIYEESFKNYWVPIATRERLRQNPEDEPIVVDQEQILLDIEKSRPIINIVDHEIRDTPLLDISEEFRQRVVNIAENRWRPGAQVSTVFSRDFTYEKGGICFWITDGDRHVLNGAIINHGTLEKPEFSIHT